jgi:hypothetical protein
VEIDDITGATIDVAMQIHRELGPGLLESAYEILLVRELEPLPPPNQPALTRRDLRASA